MAAYIVVFCRRPDCAHYAPEPSSDAKCRCSHPHKPTHMNQAICPLYSANWRNLIPDTSPPPPEKKKRTPLEQDF